MHVVVVGATGRIGRSVVNHALQRGDRVTAAVRDPRRLPQSPALDVIVADVTEEDRTWQLPADADAIVFAVGSRGTSSTVVRSDGLSNLLDAIPEGSAARVVVLSGARVEISRNAPIRRRLALRFLVQKRLRNILNDMERMEDEIALRDDLAWTVVRCTSVRDGAGRGLSAVPAGTESSYAGVSSTEVAQFVLGSGIGPTLTRSAVTLVGA